MIKIGKSSQESDQVMIHSRKGVESLLSAAKRLAAATSASRVFLFGSVAGGKFDGFGDVDFCYIVSDGADLIHTQREAQRAFADRLTPLDFVGMHEGVFASGNRLLAREIQKNGQLLYSAHES